MRIRSVSASLHTHEEAQPKYHDATGQLEDEQIPSISIQIQYSKAELKVMDTMREEEGADGQSSIAMAIGVSVGWRFCIERQVSKESNPSFDAYIPTENDKRGDEEGHAEESAKISNERGYRRTRSQESEKAHLALPKVILSGQHAFFVSAL